LFRGGDTDTNAAIVGGLVGAVIGFKNLPRDYLSKMMELDFSKK
jgi:ADP-ribosylglycohydrolase